MSEVDDGSAGGDPRAHPGECDAAEEGKGGGQGEQRGGGETEGGGYGGADCGAGLAGAEETKVEAHRLQQGEGRSVKRWLSVMLRWWL